MSKAPYYYSRKKIAQLCNGIPVVQLDYYTGEYIAEYPTLSAVAEDYDIPIASVINCFYGSVVGRMKKYEILIIRKKDYERMCKQYG